MNFGGTAFPIGFTATQTVTGTPLSLDVIPPTCCVPFLAIGIVKFDNYELEQRTVVL